MRLARITLAPLVLVLIGLNGGPAWAWPVPAGVDRIEEDWQLVLADPDLIGAGPQITTTMSPEGDNDRSFAAFNLNYRDYPFRAGGLQALAWSGDTLAAEPTSQKTAPCGTPGEAISWTQRLRLSGGWIYFDILNGNSTTWGEFGQGDNLSLAFSTSLGDLSGYDPAVSVARSGASWQSNRVREMTLVQIRYYSGGSLIAVDTTPRAVDLGTSP